MRGKTISKKRSAHHELINQDRPPFLFDENERGPSDKMKLLFEAVGRLNEDEQTIIQELLEGMIVKYEVRRWTGTTTG